MDATLLRMADVGTMAELRRKGKSLVHLLRRTRVWLFVFLSRNFELTVDHIARDRIVVLTQKLRKSLLAYVDKLQESGIKGKKRITAQQAMEATFKAFDKKETGVVSARDFAKALNKLGFKGLTTVEMKSVVEAFDLVRLSILFTVQNRTPLNWVNWRSQDGDGKVSYREFQRFVRPQSQIPKETRDVLDRLRRELRVAAGAGGRGKLNVNKIFVKFDKDNSQSIDEDELAKALKKLGFKLKKRELRMLIDLYDTDGDGRISYPEFVRWLDPKMESLRMIEKKLRRGLTLVKNRGLKLRDLFEKFDADENVRRGALRLLVVVPRPLLHLSPIHAGIPVVF